MDRKSPEALRQFSPGRIVIPILLGLGIVGYVLYGEFAKSGKQLEEAWLAVNWTARTYFWLAFSVAMVPVREFGYIWQLRLLTDRQLSWASCFQVVVLWNFFAAVSPSIIGGTAVAIFMLLKEGLSVGRTTTIVFTTIFLDQVFYTAIPLYVSFFVPQDDIFAPLYRVKSDLLGTGMVAGFWSAWGSLLAYVLFLIAALFVAPRLIHWWLAKLFGLPWLAPWRDRGLHMANDLLVASGDLRRRPLRFWLAVWAATSLAWLARYWILNGLVGAFATTPMGFFDFVLASARQAVLWVMMVLSPTPGSAGIAELGFSWLFGDLLPVGTALSVAILWRLIGYYPYLIVGVPAMTRWITRVYGRDVR
ncbi:flippase-like domain-containing protein [Methylolobus aquaticus]|nr:flippase-like domain-containing protein [Methylolobus aquaticus]